MGGISNQLRQLIPQSTELIELPKGTSRAANAPTSWTGRFWGRTNCSFNSSCAYADTVATLAEFSTKSFGGIDFYEVSLVDGFNLPLRVDPVGGSGQCTSIGCVDDLITKCPQELRTEDGGACRSACNAFNITVHCCSLGSANCRPTLYSQVCIYVLCAESLKFESAFQDVPWSFTLPSLKSCNLQPKHIQIG